MNGIRHGIDHTCDGQWRYYCQACSGLPDDMGLSGWGEQPPSLIVTEYGVRHYAYSKIDHTFDTGGEAAEWIGEREEPDDWRILKRQISDWEELE